MNSITLRTQSLKLYQSSKFFICFIGIILFISCITAIPLVAQSNDPFNLISTAHSHAASTKNLFGLPKNMSIGTQYNQKIVQIDKKLVQGIRNNYNELISTEIPDINSKTNIFYFTEFNFFTPDFEVFLISDQGTVQLENIDRGIHLKGIQNNQFNSFASLSLFENEIYGSAYSDSGLKLNFTPFISNENKGFNCIMTDESKTDLSAFPLHCNTDDFRHFIGSEVEIASRLTDNCKSIAIAIDVDYALYLKFKGNTQSITNYITGLFNNVHTLYKRESISIALSQINIHTTDDRFAHTSASEDLESFRTRYPNTKKTIKLLLSGYEKNKIASLGGIAYINTLCTPSYAYGFINVNGTYSTAPLYSWDVFAITHELGHIFGSRHTHACVWGPNKNIALDNCSKPEGSCGNPGIPSKGTIMSYCFQSGMPGVDFSLGFGSEPGNLIRQKISSSKCLITYTPTTKTLKASNTNLEANVECYDGVYTHYYFDNNSIDPSDDVLILSINKKANEIGNLKDGSLKIALSTTKAYSTYKTNPITAEYVDPMISWNVSNKYWSIQSNKKINSAINLVYYFDLKDIQSFIDQGLVTNPADLKLFMLSPKTNPSPESNHAGATKDSIKYFTSSSKSLGGFNYSKIDSNTYAFELTSNIINSGSIGASTPLVNTVQFKQMKASYSSGYNTITFNTSNENNVSYYRIEASSDQLHFDSIASVVSKSPNTTTNSYQNLRLGKEDNNLVYRIKAVNKLNQWSYSAQFSKANPYEGDASLAVYPNPVKTGTLFAEYFNKSTPQEINIRVTDIYGRVVRTYKQIAQNGKNYLNINTSNLQEGQHYLNITSKSDNAKISFTVSK